MTTDTEDRTAAGVRAAVVAYLRASASSMRGQPSDRWNGLASWAAAYDRAANEFEAGAHLEQRGERVEGR